MKVLLLSITLSFLFYSCEYFEAQPMKRISRPISEIKKEVFKGDTSAYFELRSYYREFARESFLFWALLMANKYDHPEAHLDVFYCLVSSYVGELERFNEMDINTQKMAMYHLEKARKLGVKEVEEILNDIKPKKKEPCCG